MNNKQIPEKKQSATPSLRLLAVQAQKIKDKHKISSVKKPSLEKTTQKQLSIHKENLAKKLEIKKIESPKSEVRKIEQKSEIKKIELPKLEVKKIEQKPEIKKIEPVKRHEEHATGKVREQENKKEKEDEEEEESKEAKHWTVIEKYDIEADGAKVKVEIRKEDANTRYCLLVLDIDS